MPVTVDEKFESRLVTTSANPTAELRYVIRGTNDHVEARTGLVGAAPSLFDPWGDGLLFLGLESLTIQPIGHELWEGIARYGTLPVTSQSTFSFDTGGGSQRITQSKQTVGAYAPSGSTAPDFQGAIGVTANGVEGVDIAVPIYHFSETHYIADATVTSGYKATLFALTGRVNNDLFRGFATGECLFLGAAGSQRGGGDWEIGFRFAASPNASGLTIGDITGIAKKGWEYLWVRYSDVEDTTAQTLVKRPAAVYVERVYDGGDFSLLGI